MNKPGSATGSPEMRNFERIGFFGGLAVMVTGGDGRPSALRRRLSPGLPVRMHTFSYIIWGFVDFGLTLMKIGITTLLAAGT